MTLYSICLSLPDVSLNIIYSTSIHFTGNDRISFFKIEEYYIPHFLKPVICLWALGLLPCLGYCKSAAMNVGVHLFTLEFSFFLDTCPGVGLLNHIIVLFLVFFKETPYSFSIVAAPIYISLNSIVGFTFLHTYSRLNYL